MLKEKNHRPNIFQPVPIAQLVIFRISFGLLMLWEVWRYFHYDWIRRYYIEPAFHFKYWGFEWVQAWPNDSMYWHFYALGFLAICITIGFCYRLSAALFFIGFSYVFLLDQARYLNHFYLICLISFLLIFVPAHRAFSIDALLHPHLYSKVVPAWALWLLRIQIGLVYFFGGIAKINGDWLRGDPMRMWLAERTDFPIVGQWFTEEWMVYAFAYGGLLFDLLFFPCVLWKRTKFFALAVSLFFHFTNYHLFNIGVFPWFMLAANILFLPLNWFSRFTPANESQLFPSTTHLATRQKLLLVGISIYLVIQILLPLRHHLYKGDVHWTEEGHRFSWRMKLRDKEGYIRFILADGATKWEINPLDYLTPDQLDEMSTRPDMILQFSHYLAEKMEDDEQSGDIQVYVEARVSLNGRTPQLLIDPNANLARQSRTWQRATWILPLNSKKQEATH